MFCIQNDGFWKDAPGCIDVEVKAGDLGATLYIPFDAFIAVLKPMNLSLNLLDFLLKIDGVSSAR